MQRQANVALLSGPMGIKAVTSASASVYPAVAADCSDASGIPTPQCTDEVSNQRRLAACQSAWAKDANYYEGTDRVLTSPLNGIAHGNVDGVNPVSRLRYPGSSAQPPPRPRIEYTGTPARLNASRSRWIVRGDTSSACASWSTVD